MLARARETGVDVVLGSRTIGSTIDQPAARRLLLAAGLRFSRWTTGLALTDTHNGLRVLSRTALETLKLRHRGMAYATELETHIARRELSWVEHPVSIRYSEYSRSKGQGNLNAFNILFDLFAARMGSSDVIIKIFLIASVIAVGVWLLRGRRHGGRLAITRIAGIAFAACWVLGVLAPDLVTRVANLVGVGRGTDLVLYVLVVAFLFTTAGQHQKPADLDDRAAALTRALALVERQLEQSSDPVIRRS